MTKQRSQTPYLKQLHRYSREYQNWRGALLRGNTEAIRQAADLHTRMIERWLGPLDFRHCGEG